MAAPSRAGSTARSRAMAGSAVATAELSRFCMNSALATMAATMRGSAFFAGADEGAGSAPPASLMPAG